MGRNKKRPTVCMDTTHSKLYRCPVYRYQIQRQPKGSISNKVAYKVSIYKSGGKFVILKNS